MPFSAGTYTLPSGASQPFMRQNAQGNVWTVATFNDIQTALNTLGPYSAITPGATGILILEAVTVADVLAIIGGGSGTITVDTFSGTGAQTAFTLSVDPGSTNNTWVFISGVYQFKSNYSVAGTTLTFVSAPALGVNNIQVVSGTTVAVNVPADGSVTTAKLDSQFVPIANRSPNSSFTVSSDYSVEYAGHLTIAAGVNITIAAGADILID